MQREASRLLEGASPFLVIQSGGRRRPRLGHIEARSKIYSRNPIAHSVASTSASGVSMNKAVGQKFPDVGRASPPLQQDERTAAFRIGEAGPEWPDWGAKPTSHRSSAKRDLRPPYSTQAQRGFHAGRNVAGGVR